MITSKPSLAGAPNLYVDPGRWVPPPRDAAADLASDGNGRDARAWLSDVYQRVYHPAEGENTKWAHVPIKLMAYPLTKLMYDIPNLLTSTIVESVTRSPIHNIQGMLDGIFGAVKSALGGIWNAIRGVFNPTNGAVVDGGLQILDAVISGLKSAAAIVKSAASLVGYPVYRLLGGPESLRFPLLDDAKRAAIVVINSGMPGFLGTLLDAYGDQIVRYHLSRIEDYYCVATPGSDAGGAMSDCVSKMPKDIKVVDWLALTHSGGIYGVDAAARESSQNGRKPGMVFSIGCEDRPSDVAKPENTVGQEGISWAVHFYLSGLLEKRLRGIPMQQAATEAFYEGIIPNFVNPVSLASIIGTRAVFGSSGGYWGSKPVPKRRDGYALELK